MPSPDTLRLLTAWNRRFHVYVGLFLLCFIWLFAVSGVILNHPTWEFPQFWQSRQVSSRDVAIRMPPPGDDLARARDLMDQIGVSGEIEKITSGVEVANPGLDVRVVRPGRITDIKANFQVGQATIETIQTNNWGVIHWLHHFTGVRMDRPEMRRDWALTYLWSLAMDAVCGGLIFLVGSSLFMWYPMIRKRPLGWAFLGVGILGCCLFIIELSWLF